MRRLCLLIASLLLVPHPLSAQRRDASAFDTAGAFADPGTAALVRAARATRERADSSIRSYTAVVRARMGGGMRLPMKDRTLVREENASRVRWSRDAETVVQRIAGRQQTPGGISAPRVNIGLSRLFDPASDRMYFAVGSFREESDTASADDDDFWIEHPLGAEAERHYRYESGDTLAVTLQDGTTIRAIELRVTPRRDDPHTVRGLLWVDPATGAVAQAAFRLTRTVDVLRDMASIDEEDARTMNRVPGFLKPFEFDISLMTVEYSLWDLKYWLPRTTRFEGYFRVGVLQFPGSFDISYDIEEVESDEGGAAADEAERARRVSEEAERARRVAAAWAREGRYRRVERKIGERSYIVLVPRDSVLLNSAELPPPIWSDAPGFASTDELEKMAERLKKLGAPFRPAAGTHFGWGFGEPEMVRYNRVESLSIGARASTPLPFATATLTARIGAADLHPTAEVSLLRATASRTLQLRGYHELTTADESRRALGLGNSMSALLFGRDEGEYFRASGAAFTWAPPADARRAWDVTWYGEYQNDVARNTHVALPRIWEDSVFRTNIRADEATQFGTLLRVRPWWGTDPRGVQFGIDAMVQAESGDYQHARTRIAVRSAAPLFAGARLGLELAAGTAEGDVPIQRHFFLGGASTLRGYEPSVVAGTSMARARVEVARTLSFGNLALFSDWGWAGDRTDRRPADEKLAAGFGVSLLDGVIRLDLARALRAPTGWRLDLHLDAIL